jgi:hypothetical protein
MSATVSVSAAKPDAHALATSIAQHIGPNWSVDHKRDDGYQCGATITCSANGAALWICVDYTGRAECSGRFPTMANGAQYSAGKVDYGRMGFDPGKDPKKIAADIERRCLTAYLPALEKARAYIRCDHAARAAALAAAIRIASAVGADIKDNDGAVNVWPGVDGCYALQVRPSSDLPGNPPRVDMKLREVSPETAIKVLEVLRKAGGK